MEFARRWIGIIVLVLGLAAIASCPSFASASTGGFSSATADSAWGKGSIAGSVTWDTCPLTSPSKCVYWKPYVLLQPALPSYSCSWENAWDSRGDPNIRILWAGNAQSSPGSKLTFNLNDATLFSGVQGQRVCLVAFIPTKIPNQVCISQNKVFEQLGYPTTPCDLMDSITGEVIDQMILTEKLAEDGSKMTLAKARSISVGKLANKYGRSWRQGSNRKVTCKEKSALFVCSATWKYKHKPKKGSVLVFKP